MIFKKTIANIGLSAIAATIFTVALYLAASFMAWEFVYPEGGGAIVLRLFWLVMFIIGLNIADELEHKK